MLRAMHRALVLALAAACCPDPVVKPKAAATNFDQLTATVMSHLMDLEPSAAIGAGLHDRDGKLADRSPAGLAAEIAAFTADRDALAQVAPRSLTPLQRDERDVLLYELRDRLFLLVDLDAYHTNPTVYIEPIALDAYIVRDYAPADRRTAAVVATCKQLPAYLAQARANLAAPMPKPWLDIALLQTKGMADFVDKDIRTQLPAAAPALDACKAALVEHATWLDAQRAHATASFALGEKRFLKMLAETQGVELDLAHLQQLADADLARNTAALAEASRDIDPGKSIEQVVAAQAADKPAPDGVLALATEQAATMRQFLIDQHIITIPSDDVAEVRASPPFKRWNAAFLDGPGPFEAKKLPSYYYISPPDPSWPAAEQQAYIPPKADLLYTTIHEVYPGHFIHGLHIRKNPSKVLQVFWTYSTGEGWAHYCEEMMYDAGAGGHTPQTRIGMLKEALLRNVRFVVALGEHTGGMTVEAAQQLFETKAHVDPGNAHQQAVRGTFDPMFLSYTLGKLIIRKLHADWKVVHPGGTLQQFHDELLSHGAAPLPVIRRDMLGNDSPVL